MRLNILFVSTDRQLLNATKIFSALPCRLR